MLNRKQIIRMEQVTRGLDLHRQYDFVMIRGSVHLTVINILYVIDSEGTLVICSARDGRHIRTRFWEDDYSDYPVPS